MANRDVVICSPLRTAIGTYGGTYKEMPATDLGAAVVRATLDRAKLQPGEIGTVVMGNVIQAGNRMNPARQAAINGGVPVEVPAMTVNRVCGSGAQAIASAAQEIMLPGCSFGSQPRRRRLMKHTRTSPERRRRQTRKRTPIAIRRLQGRKRTARWRIRDALSDQVRFYQTPPLDSEVDELRAEVRKDGKPISRSKFRKIAGFAIAGVVKWAIKKRFSYEELAAILDLMDNEL